MTGQKLIGIGQLGKVTTPRAEAEVKVRLSPSQ